MIDEKLIEVIKTPPDAALSIVTRGEDGPHLVNSWNSYVRTTEDGKLIIPVGGMTETERNAQRDDRVMLSICNREVQGKKYKGTGFLVKGTAAFVKEGPEFDTLKAEFPWARAALVVTVVEAAQPL